MLYKIQVYIYFYVFNSIFSVVLIRFKPLEPSSVFSCECPILKLALMGKSDVEIQ